MQKLLLSIHPFLQGLAILLAFYGAILGLNRVRSLHFNQRAVIFHRKRHALIGAISLFMLLGGMGGGFYIAKLAWEGMVVINWHKNLALLILPFLGIGIGTGLFLYFKLGKRKILPAIHGINNLILLILLLAQAYSGFHVYLKHVLKIQ